MKTAVVGSRNFQDFALLKQILEEYEISVIVSGGAKGADALGEKYAHENQIPTMIFKPDWKRLGRGAGPARNKTIVENAEFIIAFWDGISKGTKSSINIAKKLNKPLRIVRIEPS
ncbi:MAG: DUF2493 domain-containing protein [Chlorobium sp.]|nr:DUF2493 domain-containing protein [Chlorobium sp.]